MKRKRFLLTPIVAIFLLAFSLQIAPLSLTQTAVYADGGSPGEPNPPPRDSIPGDSMIQGTYVPGNTVADDVSTGQNLFDFLKQIIDNIM